MSSISVKWQNANSAVLSYGLERTELSGVIASVRGIKSYRCMRGGSFSAVYSALDRVITRLEKEKNDIRTLETTMSEILKAYKACETKVESQIKATDLKENNVSGGEGIITGSDMINLLWDLVGKFGPVLGGISALGKLLTAKWTDWVTGGKNITDFLKDLSGLIGDVAGIKAKGASANWKDWIGWNNGLEDMLTVVPGGAVGPGAVFKDIFGNSWKDAFDFTLPEGATTADKVKLGTKWAGVVLSLASNGFENIDEYRQGGISGGRAVAETVIETATDIAVDAAVGAGVSAAIGAGLAAAGATVAAPAVVIGGATVLVTWGLNKGCEWVTEKFFGEKKDLGEVVADAACDFAEWGADKLGQGCKAVKNTFTKWGKALFG